MDADLPAVGLLGMNLLGGDRKGAVTESSEPSTREEKLR